jgi:hypothetical protein
MEGAVKRDVGEVMLMAWLWVAVFFTAVILATGCAP